MGQEIFQKQVSSGLFDAESWYDLITGYLRNPPIQVSPLEAAALWRVARVLAVCEKPPLLEDYPELSVRVRGAFGRSVAESDNQLASQARLPRAEHIFFGDLGRSNNEFVRPITVRSWIDGQNMMAEVRLFGVATSYAQEVAGTLISALGNGVALGVVTPRRVHVNVLEVGVLEQGSIMVPQSREQVTIKLRTPAARIRVPSDLIKSTVRRAHNLACWQGLKIVDNVEEACRQADNLRCDARDLLSYGWSRHSRRQIGRDIPMSGLLGTLHVAGGLTQLMPYLAIASETNTGVNAALGLGWFDLV